MSSGSVRDALARIERLLGNDPAPLELERALKDLGKVEARLADRDYLKTNFDENTFCMQERSRMLLVEIDFYARVGRLWAKVLESVGVASANEVLDIGPGWFPKVEMGLVYANYAGRLRVMDRSAEAIDNLRTFLGAFDPQYTIEPVIVDFLVDAVAPAQLVAGNHFVDDVIVDRYCRDSGDDPSDVYREEASFQRVWRDILGRRATLLPTIVDTMADAFDRLVSPGGTLIVSQYPSYMERRLAMPEIDQMCREVIESVGRTLGTRGFSPRPEATNELPAGDNEFFGREAFFVYGRSA